MIDSFDELVQELSELERARIIEKVEEILTEYFASHNSLSIRTQRDKFMLMIQQQGLEAMIADKFDILSKVRGLDFPQNISLTLSIGIGYGAKNLVQSEEFARQSLDMCLGRGGDQAAVKNPNGFDFYGGVGAGVERRGKLRARMVASALGELIENSSNVIMMGHRFSDLDALGAAVGMLRAVRSMGKKSFICIDTSQNLVKESIQMLKNKGGYTDDDFKQPDVAIRQVNPNTLLIVSDVHVPTLFESKALYELCRTVVVIDHHRKLADHIKNAVIFYHEPSASSASEMVTELIQHLPVKPHLKKIEAEALLTGITLDTKNFVMRTGVGTFEAAAYLRRNGADTVEVHKMFSSSMTQYRNKAAIVANANVYNNCAIAVSEDYFDGIRIASSQAADELMSISGVNASFVVFPYGHCANISARSMGAINVQIIMEKLGGGGHHTMAAAQFPDKTIEEVTEKLKIAIDDYYKSLPEDIRKELFSDFILSPAINDENVTIVEGRQLSEIKSTDEQSQNAGLFI